MRSYISLYDRSFRCNSSDSDSCRRSQVTGPDSRLDIFYRPYLGANRNYIRCKKKEAAR